VLALIRVHSSVDASMLVPPNRRRSQALRKADTLPGMALLLPALVFFVTAAQQPSTAPAQDGQPPATVHVVANVDPVLQADLRRLFEDLGVDKLLSKQVDQAIDIMTTMLKSDARLTPEFTDEFVRRTKAGLLDGRVQDMTMQEYAKFFTHEELQQMIAYRESPVARKAAELAPRMMTDISAQVVEIVQELGKQTALDVARQHPEYLKTPDSGADAGEVVMGILGAAPDVSSSPAPITEEHVDAKAEQLHLIKRVEPVYPPRAKAAQVQGTVEFTALIGHDGKVESVTLVRGHPLLVAAAKEAVLQWEFEPYLVAGKAMKVVTNLQVTFNLAVPGQQK
jgi:TonB family protein